MSINSAEIDNSAFDDFLRRAGWGGAAIAPLAGDASTRSYYRVQTEAGRALLMSAPPAAEAAACPRDASEAQRLALGYNACARLAGPNLNAFVSIAKALRAAGVSAPGIYAADPAAGLALIEDLGDDLFARVVTPASEAMLYENAIDVLLHLHEQAPTPPRDSAYDMLDYDRLALVGEADLLLDWYWPYRKGVAPYPEIRQEFRKIMDDLARRLAPPQVMVLRDFHAENLLWLPDRAGPARVGVIDFQDGLMGSPAYDLASLLEDARRDVGLDLASAMVERYAAGAINRLGQDADQLHTEFAILALQRNAKILGIFARLAERDGKRRYLDLLPRVEAHFRRDLARPQAASARKFFTTHFPELTP